MVISSILVRTFISCKCLYKVIRKAFTEMSTTLFWTLFVILIGVICLDNRPFLVNCASDDGTVELARLRNSDEDNDNGK